MTKHIIQATGADWLAREGLTSEPQPIESVSLLGMLPRWKRLMARFFSNPYYYRFRADMEMQLGLAGENKAFSGQVLYELMFLK